jgi:uncharacterized protein (TIGR02646 family)
MRPFKKSTPPQIIKDNWIDWGIDYAKKRIESNHSFEFRWATVNSKPINQHILKDLLNDTDSHCSYCDFSPLRGSFDKSIDHFRPKSLERFYLDVCKWDNLYIACNFCQGAKKDNYNDLLLRPDEIEYEFYKYFSYDAETHEIEVNIHCKDEEKLRAITTIMIFQMNHPDQTDSRRISYLHYNNAIESSLETDLELYSHRFIFE